MLFQLRTDNHIHNSEELSSAVEATVQSSIVARLGDRLRRVEVYLEDTNAQKKGGADVRWRCIWRVVLRWRRNTERATWARRWTVQSSG